MVTVQLAPMSLAAAGAGGLVMLGIVTGSGAGPSLPAEGLLAACAYLLVSNAFLLRGLRVRHAERFGPANAVTAVRSTLVGMITGLVAASFVTAIPAALLVALAVPALLLDAVDGWVARRTNSASELGARFDMEVDAFLLLALSAFVAQDMGIWVLGIGLMRYAFVVAGWIFPWLRRPLPFRYWRKVVTAVQGIALTIAATRLAQGLDVLVVAIALALLVESFGRDLIWLTIGRRASESLPEDRPLYNSRQDS